MTPEYGASTQLEKIDMLDYADLIALNKSDKRGALDALQAVRKQYQRNHTLFEQPLEEMPVFSTKASQFNDWGTTEVYNQLIKKLNSKFSELNLNEYSEQNVSEDSTIIPPKRVRYLSEIVDNNKNYDKQVEEQALIAKKMYLIDGAKA
jgi:methylmalonyl-CoA mutase